jgi:hypothetical protein
MPHPRRAARLYAALALCAALVLAFLGGMLTERMRFDSHRSQVLERLDAARRAYHQRLMQSEQAAGRAVTR